MSEAIDEAEPVGRPSRARLVLLGIGAVIVISAVWFVVTAVLAEGELTKVKSELPRVRAAATAANVSDAQVEAQLVAKHAHRAHLYTSGPVWAVLAHVPYLGRPIDTSRGLAKAADQLGTNVVPSLIDVSTRVEPAKLRLPGNKFDLTAIASVAPTVHQMAIQTDSVEAEVSRLPTHTWLGPVDSAKNSLVSSLTSLDRTLHGLDNAVQIAPTMLGVSGTKRYFVGLENEAESRGIGGIPGSFGIVEATDGVVKVDQFFSDSELDGVKVKVDYGPDFAQRYSYEDPTGQYIWSDISPNFPYGAGIWAAMWQQKTGQRIDGALALDPTALSYLLGVTGPVTTADGTQVTAANVVALTQSTLYARFPAIADQPQRKAFLIGISQVVDDTILHSTDTAGMLQQLGKAAGQRRLLMWSTDPTVEAVLSRTVVGGVIPESSAPFIAPIVTSKSGDKLDYYLERTFTVARATCGATNKVTVTMTITNTAPGSGLSPYVTVRNDKPSYPTEPGDQRINANYFATDDAKLRSATLDGTAATVVTGAERGHPTFQVDVEIPHGATRTVVFNLTEPATPGPPIIVRQPLVKPLSLKVTDTACR